MTQNFFLFELLAGGDSTARIASSKTFFRPFCVNAEHSRYLTALISLHIVRPYCWSKKVRRTHEIGFRCSANGTWQREKEKERKRETRLESAK